MVATSTNNVLLVSSPGDVRAITRWICRFNHSSQSGIKIWFRYTGNQRTGVRSNIKCRLTDTVIPNIKTRLSHDCLIVIMAIHTSRDHLYIEGTRLLNVLNIVINLLKFPHILMYSPVVLTVVTIPEILQHGCICFSVMLILFSNVKIMSIKCENR